MSSITQFKCDFIKPLKLFIPTLIISSQLSGTPVIRVNQVGYERIGCKSAIIEDENSFTSPSVFTVKAISGTTVFTGTPNVTERVDNWSKRHFSLLDFSACTTAGTFTINCDNTVSHQFTISDNCVFSNTAQSVISFFTLMRNSDTGDRQTAVYNTPGKTVDVYGGWNDATGDRGKYLSHLSFANYFNPQQIPLVVWSLCKSIELDSQRNAAHLKNAAEEAGWGADYLTRAFDPSGYFYITVFDGWGWNFPREVCAWRDTNGLKTADYQAAFREGGGMSIAALAYSSRLKISGDSSSSFLSVAKKAYTHLISNNTRYTDDGKENIIDDYCALMAATELFKTTNEQTYLSDAKKRATSIINRQTTDGWFYSDNDKTRPFYHGSDEGLPMLALMELAEVDHSMRDQIYNSIKKAVFWYQSVTKAVPNPFGYIRQISSACSGNTTNIALGKKYTASSSETQPQVHPVQDAFDNNLSTRWASDTGSDAEWIQVDLGEVFTIENVAITWEAAFGKNYYIQISSDDKTWQTVATVTNNEGAVRKVTPLNNASTRFVRMQGVERGTRYGYSIFEFQVYGKAETTGKISNSFFMPHNNETGYWWQGENARIASLASALLKAQRLSIFTPEEAARLTQLATNQLDWILGKNPFGTCMMYGFGNVNYPNYKGKDGYVLSNFKGGICNGISAAVADEKDIAFMPYSNDGGEPWLNWRWIEQWLPHNAWFLTAISLQSYNFSKPRSPIVQSINRKHAGYTHFTLSKNTIHIKLPTINLTLNPGDISIQNLHGQSMKITTRMNKNSITIPLCNITPGIYFIRIRGIYETLCFTKAY